jgi:hypothetical protein
MQCLGGERQEAKHSSVSRRLGGRAAYARRDRTFRRHRIKLSVSLLAAQEASR